MGKNQLILLVGAAVVLLGGFFLISKNDVLGTRTALGGEDHDVRMTPDGFEPKSVEIKRGDRVTFINEDDKDRWPASNLHPTHEIYSEFDPLKPVKSGESWSFQFLEEGTWFYHDHLIPLFGGKVIVK